MKPSICKACGARFQPLGRFDDPHVCRECLSAAMDAAADYARERVSEYTDEQRAELLKGARTIMKDGQRAAKEREE